MLRSVLTTAFAFGLSQLAAAQVATYDLDVARMALHPGRPVLYVSLTNQDAIAAIDTDSLALLATVPVGDGPFGIAVSPDGSKLYVSLQNEPRIAVLETAGLANVQNITTPEKPADVAVDALGRVYATPGYASTYVGIMRFDASGQFLGYFDGGVFVYYFGLLAMGPDNDALYFANTGLSPGTLAKYDLTVDPPAKIWQNAHGALGSNGQDLAVSHDGAFMSYACGGGNFNYDIFKISTTTFQSQGAFATGPYPREITYSVDDLRAYCVHSANRIDVFDTQTFQQLSPIVPSGNWGEAHELLAERRGRYLFATFGDPFFGIPPRLAAFDLANPVGSAFCSTLAAGSCPCGNSSGLPVPGCINGTGQGALLVTGGTSSIAADDLVFDARGLPGGNMCVLAQSALTFTGSPFFSGRLCITPPEFPFAGKRTKLDGTIRYGGGLAAQGSWGPGDTLYFQLFYRDGVGDPCHTGLNLSNGVKVIFLP